MSANDPKRKSGRVSPLRASVPFKFRPVFFTSRQPEVDMPFPNFGPSQIEQSTFIVVSMSTGRRRNLRKQKEQAVTKIISLTAIVGLIIVSSSTADARGGPGGGGGVGASGFSPGQQFRLSGAVNGYPGASGYAPGHLKRLNGPVPGRPGASGYAPGHKFKNH